MNSNSLNSLYSPWYYTLGWSQIGQQSCHFIGINHIVTSLCLSLGDKNSTNKVCFSVDTLFMAKLNAKVSTVLRLMLGERATSHTKPLLNRFCCMFWRWTSIWTNVTIPTTSERRASKRNPQPANCLFFLSQVCLGKCNLHRQLLNHTNLLLYMLWTYISSD